MLDPFVCFTVHPLRIVTSFMVSVLLCSCTLVFAEETELRISAVVKAVQQAQDSVVNIHGHKTVSQSTERGYNDRQVNGMGTGVIIDERGYIVTNHHVVDGVRRIRVKLSDDREVVARLVDHDPKTDLAIIKIPSNGDLPKIAVGTSNDLMTGETVIALGNAYGYEHTVTKGIISALHRSVQVSDSQGYNDLIQTDASINPGNSGGPLLNIDGEMIGINVAVRVGAQGIGFALPVDEVMEVAGHLLSIRKIDRRWHGVTGNTRISQRNVEFVVETVGKRSPAERGGLKPGDVVTEIDGFVVHRTLDFERALIGRKATEEVPVHVLRENQSKTLKLVLSSTSQQEPNINDRAWELFGLKLESAPAARVRRINSRYRGGLRVISVRSSSPASVQGIQRGDILVGMHVWETVSLENVAYIMNRNDIKEFQPVKFYVLRGNETLYGHLPITLR